MGNGPKHPAHMMAQVAERCLALLDGHAIVGGSLRRGSSKVGDVDLVLAGISKDEARARLAAAGFTLDVQDDPRDEFSIRVSWCPFRIKVDVWTPEPGSEGACLMHATGPGMYNSVMRRWAGMNGMKLRWDGVWRENERIAGSSEQECCEALGWPNPPPDHRERFMEWIDPYLEILNESV